MTEAKNEYGVVGLGRMGGNLSRQALEKGIRVVGFTRHGALAAMIESGLVEVRAYADLKAELSPPRANFCLRPGGAGSRWDPRRPRLPTRRGRRSRRRRRLLLGRLDPAPP